MLDGELTWKQIVQFGKSKESIFRKFISLTNETPSEGTINRVFSFIDNLDFENFFIEWYNSISSLKTGQIIAIDSMNVRMNKIVIK